MQCPHIHINTCTNYKVRGDQQNSILTHCISSLGVNASLYCRMHEQVGRSYRARNLANIWESMLCSMGILSQAHHIAFLLQEREQNVTFKLGWRELQIMTPHTIMPRIGPVYCWWMHDEISHFWSLQCTRKWPPYVWRLSMLKPIKRYSITLAALTVEMFPTEMKIRLKTCLPVMMLEINNSQCSVFTHLKSHLF